MKRLFAAILCMMLVLAGCDSAAEITDDTSAAETEAPAAQDIALVTGGVSEYIIVRSDTASSAETQAAVFLRKYMEKCGVKTKITTDWEGNGISDYEIVVGNTLRTAEQGNVFDAHAYGEEGYYAAASGTRIYIGGGSNAALQKAVEAFLTDFFGYAGDVEKASPVTELKIPGDYMKVEKQTYAITSLKLGDRSLADYTIVVDSFSSDASEGAKTLQREIYRSAGIWMDIVKRTEAVESPAIRFSADKPTRESSLEIKTAANGDLVIKSDVPSGFERIVSMFLRENIANKSGDVKLAANYQFVRELGTVIHYSDFGAVGDGVTDDLAAIIAAHDYANLKGIPVKADAGATYYIGAADKGAVVQTDTDWTGAKFIINDAVADKAKKGVAIFNVTATKASYNIAGKISAVLPKDSTNIGMTFPEDSVIKLVQAGTKLYIRKGKNANSGSDQQELIVVDKAGNIDPSAPLIWDYTNITGATVIPMDEKTVTLKGGEFTTIANTGVPSDGYWTRGIKITRSNVVVKDLVHYVKEEGSMSAPYSGILVIQDCANVHVENCVFTGHKTYTEHKSTGDVSKGTYDISPSRTINLSFKNCRQSNDILDTTRWGVMGSNFCKNITLDGCSFSRFDAHQGVANVTILNSTLGHQCLNAIGSGLLRVEGTTLYGSSLINLRNDYGSTWNGDVIIKDCTWIPNKGKQLTSTYCIIGGQNTEDHDFGYQCYMPTNITIENLHIDDSNALPSFKGVYLFADFSPSHLSVFWEKNMAKFPIVITEKVTIKNLTTASGKGWNLSKNVFMFNNVEIVVEDNQPASAN